MRPLLFAALALSCGILAEANAQTADKIIVVPDHGIFLPDPGVFIPHASIGFPWDKGAPSDKNKDFCNVCRCCYRPPDMSHLERALVPSKVPQSAIRGSFGVDLKKLEAATPKPQ